MRYWLCLFAALALLCLPAGAVELPKELTDALPSQAERLLEGETGDLLGGVSALWGNLRQEAGKILRSRLKTAAGVLFTVLLCGMLGGLRDGNGAVPDFVPMGGALVIAALTASSLKNLVGLGWEAMEATSVFGKALLGALAVSLAAGGAVQTASLQQVGTVLFGTFLLELIRRLLLPLVYLYAATVTAAAIAPETPLRSLAEAIRKAVSWALGGSLAAFTLYLTLTGAVSGAADQAAVRAAKAVLSGTVPVVGGILSDAAETLLAGAGVLQGRHRDLRDLGGAGHLCLSLSAPGDPVPPLPGGGLPGGGRGRRPAAEAHRRPWQRLCPGAGDDRRLRGGDHCGHRGGHGGGGPMMDALRTWLYGVFCAALLLTLTQGLLPKGKLRSLASLAGGLILLLALLRPLGVGKDWNWDASAFQAEVAERQKELSAERQAQLAAIIAEETEAYIWENGEDLKSVKVEVREVDGVLLPWSAELGCPYGEALSRMLSEDLGIPRERQHSEGD